ncbi:MAG: carbohydrate binding domain-containing protein [ANME-2 cluster archaeon]|nr:carbohydrate binding domain-containing protein [ANME-2 cluster archaeon]
MKFKKYLLFVIFTLILLSGQTAEASSVKIWDTMVKDTGHKFYSFDSSYAWANKDNWVQVPYDTTNYNFIGNQVIENGNFWFFLHDTGFDSPFMYANISGTPGRPGEMYIKTTDNINRWNFYKKSVNIVKNTPEELIVIVDAGYFPGINVVQYKIKDDSHFIEAKAMTDHEFLAGFHSSPNRFAVAPIKSGVGTDFVVDPKDYSRIPEGERIWFNPGEQYENLMMQEINFGGLFFNQMIIYDDWTFARPSIDVYKEDGMMRLGSMRAFMQPGTANERIFFALINEENIFHEESPNAAISAGGSYTSIRDLTIPGRWRMSGRVRAADGSKHYYTQDVYDQNFVFVSPIRGTLEALALYLYDRTSETPSDITTPMDVYRDITGQRTTVPDPTLSIPSDTNPDPQSNPIPTSTPDTVPNAAPDTAPDTSINMNPNFESGTEGWNFYTNGKGTFSISSPGYDSSNAAQVTLSSVNTNIQIYQEGITLEPDTRYRLSFAAYSTTGHDVTVKMLKHVSPYTAYAPDFTANLDTSWQTFTTEFTTSGFTNTVDDGRLRFWFAPFAASKDIYYFDNIRLEKIDIQ